MCKRLPSARKWRLAGTRSGYGAGMTIGSRSWPRIDHPWLLVSPDGIDVYVGLNMDDSYFVSSHDGGQTFGAPYRTNTPTPGHWWDANGAAMAPDGTPYFSIINFFLNYRGVAEVH